MARKPVLTGGKKDEIIKEATKLFFEKGYEATSVRMIMNQVGGEIGMFYHYFKSKDELFDKVVECFFKNYEEKFRLLIEDSKNPEEFVDAFLPIFSGSMGEFEKLRGNMHWTIQSAMSSRTISALRPAVVEILQKWNAKSDVPVDILAGQLIYGISATIHSESFETMSDEEKRDALIKYIEKIM